MKILKAEEMKFIDESSIKLTGINSLVLMENAGRGAFEVIWNKFKDKNKFVIIAGSGNNGGDGLVIARYLFDQGKEVKVFLLASNLSKLSQDNKVNFEILEKLGVECFFIKEENISRLINAIKNADVVIDSIFGTGFKPPVKGYKEKAIDYINRYSKNVVSIDIPSGLSADTGNIDGKFVKADITITFGYPKVCHILYPASEFCGEVFIVDISLDKSYEKIINRNLLTISNIELPKREKDSHKYKFGHNLIIGGSTGKSGAVILSALASTNAGAGLTTVFIPEDINLVIEENLIEEMSIPAPSNDGMFSKKASKYLKDIIKNGKFSSITIGMGMGVSEGTVNLMNEVLKQKLPLVIDADGINSLVKLSKFKQLLKKRKYPTVLTPHLGEFSRLTGIEVKVLKENLEEIALQFSKETNSILVVKFSRTLIVFPDETVYYSIAGNEGMAKAGTGDVLAGIIGALINRLPVIEAIKTAVLLHGIAGDFSIKDKGKESIRARDVINCIYKTYNFLENQSKNQSLIKKLTYLI